MNPTDLERLVDRELRQLPPLRAPHTLLPRVLAAVEQWSRQPWYSRRWLTWPIVWQIASTAALLLLVFGGAMLLPAVHAMASRALIEVLTRGAMYHVADAAVRTEATMAAAQILWAALWSSIVEPLVGYALVLVMLMCLACAAVAAALNQVTPGRA